MFSTTTLLLLVLTALAEARPGQTLTSKRSLTPDNTCGNVAAGSNHGYICDASIPNGGACCSQSGYCGNTASYCGTGCQAAYGTCGNANQHSGNSAAPVVRTECTWTVPNAGAFTHSQLFDFSKMSAFPSTGLAISTDTIDAGSAPYSQKHTTENVAVTGGTLQLKVPGGQHASPILGSEIYTTDRDILYASVRTTAIISNVAGTCHGQFFYKSDTQESDIEILTAKLASGIHYTNQPSTTATQSLPADAATTMHEYRLDWLPSQTLFYLDGVLQQVETRSVPSVPGPWLWNNWSNGDANWSAGPPDQDNVFHIGKIEMYYNRTGSAGACKGLGSRMI